MVRLAGGWMAVGYWLWESLSVLAVCSSGSAVDRYCTRRSPSLGWLSVTLEAFSPGVEKRLCRFFASKNFGVCNAFLHTKLADQLETWHSKPIFFSTAGLNASTERENSGRFLSFHWSGCGFLPVIGCLFLGYD